jgi:hypothetical protein
MLARSKLLKTDGQNVAARRRRSVAGVSRPRRRSRFIISSGLADLCDVPQRTVTVDKRMLHHEGNFSQFTGRDSFCALPAIHAFPQETI